MEPIGGDYKYHEVRHTLAAREYSKKYARAITVKRHGEKLLHVLWVLQRLGFRGARHDDLNAPEFNKTKTASNYSLELKRLVELGAVRKELDPYEGSSRGHRYFLVKIPEPEELNALRDTTPRRKVTDNFRKACERRRKALPIQRLEEIALIQRLRPRTVTQEILDILSQREAVETTKNDIVHLLKHRSESTIKTNLRWLVKEGVITRYPKVYGASVTRGIREHAYYLAGKPHPVWGTKA